MYTLMHDLKTYFENKPDKTEDEGVLLERITKEIEYAPIAFVSKEDIENCRYDTSKMTYEDLQMVASRMCDYYFKYADFVGDLEMAVENCLGLEKNDADDE
jgi:hypothetical protein